MSVTSYERLRMTHRTLLQETPTATALRDLLEELPGHLDSIATTRPALADEVEAGRQYLQRLQAHVAASWPVDEHRVAQSLHRVLAPLFAS
jgi:hypothetical protein